MPKTFCVVGHDARQQAAARVLRRAGYGVTAADNAAAADYILLPMSQGRVSDEVARTPWPCRAAVHRRQPGR